MIWGNKTLAIIDLAMKVLAPCAISFLENSNVPAIANMDAGKKNVLIGLLRAVNARDSVAAKHMKAAEEEVKKIQGL